MGDWERFLVLEEPMDRSHQGKTYVNYSHALQLGRLVMGTGFAEYQT